MKILGVRSSVFCILLLSISPISLSQQRSNTIVCKREAFAALKPFPELDYECPEDIPNESDDRILKCPQRIEAIKKVIKELESITDPNWWATAAGDLNICGLHEKPGALSAEEREEYTGPEYQARLMGDSRIRLVLMPDPCYQTEFNGANGYLLYKKGARVYVTEVLNGYYSRMAKSVSLLVSRVNGEQVIEIKTVNISGMRPELTSFYYVIDESTNRAVPRKRSRIGNRKST